MKRTIHYAIMIAVLPLFASWHQRPVCFRTVIGDCEEARSISAKTTSFASSEIFTRTKALLLVAAMNGNEHGVVFGRDLRDSVVASGIMTSGKKNYSPVNTNFPGAFADLHNHPGSTAPSTGDIYQLIKTNSMHAAFDTRFTILPDGTVHALVIIDKKKALAFIAAYPAVQSPGYSPRFPEVLFNEFAEMKSYLVNIDGIDQATADEMTTAFILEKYHTGLALLRQNKKGAFQKLNTVQEISANGKIIYKTRNCP